MSGKEGAIVSYVTEVWLKFEAEKHLKCQIPEAYSTGGTTLHTLSLLTSTHCLCNNIRVLVLRHTMRLHQSVLTMLGMSLFPTAQAFSFQSHYKTHDTSESVSSFTSFTSFTSSTTSTTQLHSISKQQIGALDGSNYNALELFLAAEGVTFNNNKNAEKLGRCNVVVGSLDENPKDRIVGIAAASASSSSTDGDAAAATHTQTVPITNADGSKMHLYKDSIAKVPNSVSDEDAISTCIAALTGVHCAYFDPDREEDKVVKGVGGSDDDFILPLDLGNDHGDGDGSSDKVGKKVVVLGGGDYASFIAE